MLFVKESTYRSLRDECVALEKENATLRTTIDSLQSARTYTDTLRKERAQEVEEKPLAYVMPYDEFEEFLNPEPNDQEQRNVYIAQVAGYFNGGLRDYVKYLASSFKNELARFPVTEREADFYRASINVCYLILEWGERCIAEHYANVAGARGTTDAFDEPDEAVEQIKRAIS
jgi:hypothetical protein